MEAHTEMLKDIEPPKQVKTDSEMVGKTHPWMAGRSPEHSCRQQFSF
jgi:hypothetical protein